uniref:Sphingosine kinase 1 n=1 Tax=Zonotrichia albicollis TaxID=44394 RepID=A0A8D2N8X1_ZONAL
GVGTHPPRPRGTELVGHSPKNPKSGSSLQSQASPEGEPEAAALPHSRACSCLLLLLLPCLPHRAAQWPPPVPLHGDHWAWGRRDLKQLGRQRAGTPARLVITAQAGDCLASCITAWAHCLGLGSPSGAGVTIWGWGHHLGLGSLSGGWQQEGQRDGWRVMLQISPLSPTERAHHAHEKVRDEDLSQWDTLVVMSGDGLLFEVVNGLMERPDWREAMKKPLCILPGVPAPGHPLPPLLTNCTFILCKGLYTQMDLVSLSTASGKRFFSFLGFGWGFISDVDIDSEKYRWLGSARFTLGTLQCLLQSKGGEKGNSTAPPSPAGFSLPPSIPGAVGHGAATAWLWGQRVSVSASQSVLVPGISLCPGAVAAPLAPSPPRHGALFKGIHSLQPWLWSQLQPALPHPQLPAPLCSPNRHLPDFPPARRAWGAGLELLQMMHPQSSGSRALQPKSSSQPSPASSGAPGEGHVFQNPSGGWGHEKGFVQAAPGSGAPRGQQESTGSWGWRERGGFGLLGAALGVSGSNNTFGFSCCSQFITAATVSQSKSKGELWLHPYLWQRHLLSLTPPWAAGRALPDTPCSPWMLRGCLSSA